MGAGAVIGAGDDRVPRPSHVEPFGIKQFDFRDMKAAVIARLRFFHRKPVVLVSGVVREKELLGSVSISVRKKAGPGRHVIRIQNRRPLVRIPLGNRVVVRASQCDDRWIAFRSVAGRQHRDACNSGFGCNGDLRYLLAAKFDVNRRSPCVVQ